MHNRPEGTASRNFSANRNRFTENEDFIVIQNNEICRLEIKGDLLIPNRGVTLITESGYLMLVKSFTDELAWRVQKQLVSSYFRIKNESVNLNDPDFIEDRLLLALTERKALRESKKQLESKVIELEDKSIEAAPKIEFYDATVTSTH